MYLYLGHRNFSQREELASKDWESVLKLSTMWGFDEARAQAIEKLAPTTAAADPIQIILLAKEHNVPQWYSSSLKQLVERQDPLTVEPDCAATERSYSRLSDDNGGDKWAEYGVNQDQLRNKRDFMFRGLKRDIWADAVEGNGEENGGHSGPIRYGVNKSQGSKY